MLRKTSERGFVVIIAIVVAVIIAVAIIIVIASGGEDATEPATTPVTGQPEQPPEGPTTEPGPEQPPTPGPEQPPVPPGTPPQPGTLPADWDQLSSAEKIALNPLGCDIATQTIWASDGSCHDKPGISSQMLRIEQVNSIPRELICLEGEDVCGFDASVQVLEPISTTSYRAGPLDVRPSRSNPNEDCVWVTPGFFRLTTESGQTHLSNAQPLRNSCIRDLAIDSHSSLYIAFDVPEADYPDRATLVSLDSDWANFNPDNFGSGLGVTIRQPAPGQTETGPIIAPGQPEPFRIGQLERAILTCYHGASLADQCNLGGISFTATETLTASIQSENMAYQHSSYRDRKCIMVKAGFFRLQLANGKSFDSEAREIPGSGNNCAYQRAGAGSIWYVRFKVPTADYPHLASRVAFESVGPLASPVQTTTATVKHHYVPVQPAPMSYVDNSFKAACSSSEASFCSISFEVTLLDDLDVANLGKSNRYPIHVDYYNSPPGEQCLRLGTDFYDETGLLDGGRFGHLLFACQEELPPTIAAGTKYKLTISTIGGRGVPTGLIDGGSIRLRTTPEVTIDNIQVDRSRNF